MKNKLKWTDEYIKKYVYDLVERDNIPKEEIPIVFKSDYICKNGLSTPFVSRFHSNRYALINFVYPNLFTLEEFRKISRSKRNKPPYWTKENFIKHIKEMVEYENVHIDDIPKIFSARYLIDKGFSYPLSKFTDGSPYETFEMAYPNRFKKEDFIKYSKIKRTLKIRIPSKEDTIKKVKENIKTELRMEIEEIPSKINYNDIIKLGIEKPFRKYFNNSFYELFESVFPNKFKKSDYNKEVNNKSYKISINKKSKL